jgi:hypothetical protein
LAHIIVLPRVGVQDSIAGLRSNLGRYNSFERAFRLRLYYSREPANLLGDPTNSIYSFPQRIGSGH